jgi:hypothetical protein
MRSDSLRWLRLALLTAAGAALLFLATGAALWHHDAPGTTASCSICYAAHLPALSSMPAGTPAAAFAVAWFVAAELRLTHAAPDALSSAPRAPPV